MDDIKEFDEQQYNQIKTDLLHFKNNEEQLRNTLMLYVTDMSYSRASLSKAVKEVNEEVDFKIG